MYLEANAWFLYRKQIVWFFFFSPLTLSCSFTSTPRSCFLRSDRYEPKMNNGVRTSSVCMRCSSVWACHFFIYFRLIQSSANRLCPSSQSSRKPFAHPQCVSLCLKEAFRSRMGWSQAVWQDRVGLQPSLDFRTKYRVGLHIYRCLSCIYLFIFEQCDLNRRLENGWPLRY